MNALVPKSSTNINELKLLFFSKQIPYTLKESNPEDSLEGLLLKLKLQYFANLMQSQLIGEDPDAEKD